MDRRTPPPRPGRPGPQPHQPPAQHAHPGRGTRATDKHRDQRLTITPPDHLMAAARHTTPVDLTDARGHCERPQRVRRRRTTASGPVAASTHSQQRVAPHLPAPLEPGRDAQCRLQEHTAAQQVQHHEQGLRPRAVPASGVDLPPEIGAGRDALQHGLPHAEILVRAGHRSQGHRRETAAYKMLSSGRGAQGSLAEGLPPGGPSWTRPAWLLALVPASDEGYVREVLTPPVAGGPDLRSYSSPQDHSTGPGVAQAWSGERAASTPVR